jgi:hypothetical protein
MQRLTIVAGTSAAFLGLTGCAASGPSATSSLLTPVVAPAAAAYTLSADELQLDCKKLAGRMQIRILEIRDYNERQQASLLSRALQSGASTVAGGSMSGTDPNGQYAKDRAMLEAYNAQLAAKNCKSYDLNAELKPKDFHETPTANIKPASAAAPAKAN